MQPASKRNLHAPIVAKKVPLRAEIFKTVRTFNRQEARSPSRALEDAWEFNRVNRKSVYCQVQSLIGDGLTLRSKSYLFLFIVLGLAALSGFLYTQRPYKYGLDVRGGVRFTFEMDASQLTAEQKQNMAQVKANLQSVLEKRIVGSIGVAEGTVQMKEPSQGQTQFIVELPGEADIEKARGVLSTTASIKWYHAKNLTTEQIMYRPYEESGKEAEGGNPAVTFRKRNDTTGKEIKPGDPEYQTIIAGWELILSGDELARAEAIPTGESYIPGMRFSNSGAEKMERWTRANQYRGEKLAAVLDGVVLSVAPLAKGAIIREEGQIQGTYTTDYVKNLVNLLNSGALPVSLKEISSQKVDPTIGQQALDKIVMAGMISFGIIALFMVVYYVFPGFVALLALLLYILFSLAVLKFIGATFSLAAIAGFILSVGMAVDANILVFERVKEELREGRDLMRAIDLGFKRALSAIIDSNVCTILTCAVLANLGTGPVKGFANTLIIGVAISLFTAITVTRSLLKFLVGSGIGTNPKLYGLERGWFGERLEAGADENPLPIINRSKLYFMISALPIIPGVIFLMMGGLKPNVEFQTGYEAVYAVSDNSITSASITSKLEASGIKGSNIKFASAKEGRLVYITVPQTDELKTLGTEAASKKITESAGMPVAASEFTFVSPTVRDETYRNAVLGIIFSALLIVLYLAIRFGSGLGGFAVGIRFAIASVVALIHDVIVVVGLAAVAGYFMGWEISSLFITAMLTVIGFSTHDTIVIFDRIRENLRRHKTGESFERLVDRSITASLARSLNTSMTVIVTLVLLITIGSATPDLKLFNLAMVIGIISGTYSSIFNAAPILYLWDKMIVRKKGEQFGIVRLAEEDLARQRMTAAQVVQPAAAEGMTAQPPAGYGQVRRRSSAQQKGTVNLDDEP